MRAPRPPSPPIALALVVFALALGGCKGGEERASPRPDRSAAEPLEPALPIARKGADAAALEYTLRFEDAHKHMIDVELSVAGPGPSFELVLPTWTPGSYLIREYARHIEGLVATSASGAPLPIEKVKKNRWRVTGGSQSESLSIRYRVYAREMSVRTNFVDDEIAVIVGAATFLTLEGRERSPHDVAIALRPGWARSVTGLDAHPSGEPNRYLAASFDELVDSPIVIGNPIETTFAAGGAEHRIATFAARAGWDEKKSTDDVARIVREHQAFWGVVPYDHYVILNALLAGGGTNGLEHLDSTLLTANRLVMTKPSHYRSWLGLVSHEVFHIWNGKRLRPAPLGPFDYENENYTDDLWIVEGLTQYYDDLIMARAGLYTEKQYLAALGGQFASLQRTPGRLAQPLSGASYDAWIKFYRADENSINSSVSYYTKGAVVGFLLDMTIRRLSGGRRSLDDVMRLAFQRYSGKTGYTSAEFRATASEVAGADLSDFFRRALDSTEELDYDAALEFVGLRFKPVSAKSASAAKDDDDDDDDTAYLGASLSSRGEVTRVLRETPAFDAGLNVEDEVLAIDGERVEGGDLAAALSRHQPGDEIAILLARRGAVRTLRATLSSKPEEAHVLEKRPSRTATQASRAADWLAPVAR